MIIKKFQPTVITDVYQDYAGQADVEDDLTFYDVIYRGGDIAAERFTEEEALLVVNARR